MNSKKNKRLKLTGLVFILYLGARNSRVIQTHIAPLERLFHTAFLPHCCVWPEVVGNPPTALLAISGLWLLRGIPWGPFIRKAVKWKQITRFFQPLHTRGFYLSPQKSTAHR